MHRIIRSFQVHAAHRFALAFAALAVVALLAAFGVSLDALTPEHALAGVQALTASVFVPVVVRSQQDLARLASGAGAVSRTVRGPYYDTQTYAIGGQVQLSYFGAINADKSMSNARGNGGVFPAGVYFEPLTLSVDILSQVTTSAGVVAGAVNDIALINNISRGFARITLGDISFPEIPMRMLHQTGAPMGNINGTYTAPIDLQQGYNGVQDGGYCVAGSFIIGPNVPFSVTLNWPAAQAISVATTIAVVFDGNWTLPTG